MDITFNEIPGPGYSLLYRVEWPLKIGDEPYVEIAGIDKITDAFKENGKLIVPEKINGYKVKSIRKFAFYGDKYIKNAILPDTINVIREGAFKCSDVVSIHLGKDIKEIEENAFSTSRLLTNINLPEGLEKIHDSVFKSCSSLKSITLPDTLTHLGRSVFDYCESLESIHIGSGLEDMQILAAFAYKCKNLSNITVSSSNKHFKTCGNALYNIDNNQLIRAFSGPQKVNLSIPGWVGDVTTCSFDSVSLGNLIIRTPSLPSISFANFKDIDDIYCIVDSQVYSSLNSIGTFAIHPIKENNLNKFLESINDNIKDLNE